MAKQTFTTGQVLLASQLTSLQQTAMLGGAASNKTSSYTLVAADAGTAISMTSTSATTITVNTGLFAAGDTVQITNLGAGVCTITAGTATVNTSASLALAQYESGTLDFTSTSAAIFIKGAGAAAASGGITLISNTVASALSSLSLSSIPQTHKTLLLVFSGVRHSGNYTTTKGATVQAAATGPAETQLQTGNAAYLFGENNFQTANIGYMTNGYLIVDNYSSTTISKTYYGQNGYWNNSDSDRGIISTFQGNFHSTSAVSSIDIFRTGGSATFSNETTIASTSIRLYGLS